MNSDLKKGRLIFKFLHGGFMSARIEERVAMSPFTLRAYADFYWQVVMLASDLHIPVQEIGQETVKVGQKGGLYVSVALPSLGKEYKFYIPRNEWAWQN